MDVVYLYYEWIQVYILIFAIRKIIFYAYMCVLKVDALKNVWPDVTKWTSF